MSNNPLLNHRIFPNHNPRSFPRLNPLLPSTPTLGFLQYHQLLRSSILLGIPSEVIEVQFGSRIISIGPVRQLVGDATVAVDLVNGMASGPDVPFFHFFSDGFFAFGFEFHGGDR